MDSRTVLLVEHDADMRLYLRSCVRRLVTPAAHVLEAGDGLDALHLVRAGDVDLVISAVRLPGIDGHRLRRAIRDDPALRHVAVLLLDAGGSADVRSADDVLAGPFNGRQLLAALDGLTRRG